MASLTGWQYDMLISTCLVSIHRFYQVSLYYNGRNDFFLYQLAYIGPNIDQRLGRFGDICHRRSKRAHVLFMCQFYQGVQFVSCRIE